MPPSSQLPPGPVPPNFSSFICSGITEIVAGSGPNEKRFHVHSDIITTQSSRSTAVDRINFTDFDSHIIGRFVEFLYIGNYQFPELHLDEETEVEAQSLAGYERTKGMNALLIHAELYLLASGEEVEALQSMALERLSTALEAIGGCVSRGAPKVTADVIELLDYVYSETRYTPEDPIRKFVSVFTAKHFHKLVEREEIRSMFCERIGFPADLMKELARRFFDMDSEVQDGKARTAALQVKVQELEAENVRMNAINAKKDKESRPVI